MTREPPTRRVEVSFVGAPPARQIERASGVSEVEVDGRTLRCLVCGSFQPFLEALRGHEVVNLSTGGLRRRHHRARPRSADRPLGMGRSAPSHPRLEGRPPGEAPTA